MHSNNTISSSDTYANDRADSHINMMQAQREKVTFSDGKTYELPIKDDSNEK